MKPVQKKKWIFLLLILLLPLVGADCIDDDDDDAPSLTAVSLSSNYPPDMDIPVRSGTSFDGTTGFVIQDSPFAVIPFLVNRSDLFRDDRYAVTDLSSIKPSGGSIYGSDLYVINETLAAVGYTGSDSSFAHVTGVVIFNPTSGAILANVDCSVTATSGTFKDSSGSAPGTFTTTSVSGVTTVNDQLFVSTSNLIYSGSYDTYNPGTVLVFNDIQSLTDSSTPDQILFTGQDGGDANDRFFNPVQVSNWDDKVLLVSSGRVLFSSNDPTTNSAVEVLQPGTPVTRSTVYPMGLAALGGSEVITYTNGSSQTIAVFGSSKYGRAYRINLTTQTILESASDPIQFNTNSNETTTVAIDWTETYLYTSSGVDDTISVYQISDLQNTTSTQTPTALSVINVKDAGSSGTTFPGNLVGLPSAIGFSGTHYTTGDPPDVRVVYYP